MQENARSNVSEIQESVEYSNVRITVPSEPEKTPNGLQHVANEVASKNESDSETNGVLGPNCETSASKDDQDWEIVTVKDEYPTTTSQCTSNEETMEGDSVKEDEHNTSVEEVYEVIGVSRKTKITDCNENEPNTQKENVSGPRKRRIKEVEEDSEAKKFKNRDFNIKLPYCDYLLKQMSIPLDGNSCSNSSTSSKSSVKLKTSDTEAADSFGLKKTFKNIINEVKKTNPKQFALPTEYLVNLDLNLIASEKGIRIQL